MALYCFKDFRRLLSADSPRSEIRVSERVAHLNLLLLVFTFHISNADLHLCSRTSDRWESSIYLANGNVWRVNPESPTQRLRTEDPKWNSFTLMALTRDRKFYVGPIEVPQGKSVVFRSQTFDLPEVLDIFITYSPIAPRHPATLGKVLLVGFFIQGDQGKVL
ncbi:hypothetical protein FOCC_FOCC015267, partial [Frankliniella occidentalis]